MHRRCDGRHHDSNCKPHEQQQRNSPLLSVGLLEKVDRSCCLWHGPQIGSKQDPHRVYGTLVGYVNPLPSNDNKPPPHYYKHQHFRFAEVSGKKQHSADGSANKPLIADRVANRRFKMEKINIKHVGILLFILASLFCIYQISVLENERPLSRRYTRALKLVNVFTRHGDRAPSDRLPEADRHRENPTFFWPNGLSNLTETGQQRMVRVGMELRRKYYNHIDFEPSHFLALSSPIYRCRESLQLILKGIFDVEQTQDKGRQLVDKNFKRPCNSTLFPSNKDCLPQGPGSPDGWKQIPIDTSLVPSLTYEYLNNCPFRKKNPSPIDEDLTRDPTIKSINGVQTLLDTLKRRYNQTLNFDSLGLYSSIVSELNLARTTSTINYTDHYADWINQVIPKTRHQPLTTLFDIYEHIAVIGYQNRIKEEANYIQSGPLITSLIESSMVALNRSQIDNSNVTIPEATKKRLNAYKDKRMVFYATHDSIIQKFMATMGVINVEDSYESRVKHWYKKEEDDGKFLNGLKMCNYGTAIRFETWEMELEGSANKYAYVQASLYNKDDGKFAPVEFRPIELGTICRRTFARKYSRSPYLLSQYYSLDFGIDMKYQCPFNLLRNITSSFMIDDNKMNQLCQ